MLCLPLFVYFSLPAMDNMREELLRVRAVRDRAVDKEITLVDCIDLIKECELSKFLLNSELHKKLLTARDDLLKFTRRLMNLFQKPSSYYNLVEIVRDREDIAALVEGQVIPRFLVDSPAPEDQWVQLREFSSCTEMKQHLYTLRDQQRALIGSLQEANSKRSTVDTCVCVSTSGPQNSDILVCILCRAKYHVSCCEWDPFLDRLPEGAYLCVRCLRGRRPCIEDVQAACNLAPANSMEVVLVRELVCRGRELACEAKTLLADVAVLGGELSDELKDRFILRTWESCTRFILVSVGGQRRFFCSVSSQHRCLGETVGWILCEAGCARWYHYVCIGMTAESAKSLPSYICYRCSSSTQQVTQHPVAV
ncbi:PHD-finger [Ancylostoma duodenale]|uniref:PHD-finger n=1 Tax=Ancylostoma duodenale TaxID=51022 RepID=A0A0C2DB12_9BILA|nr:PHD-finger [Ancylostoma duodenale]